MVKRSIINQIFGEIRLLRVEQEDLRKLFQSTKEPVAVPKDALFSLPDHLRKTYLALAKQGEADATQISILTGRVRPVESNYLNQLKRLGWVNTRHVSRMGKRSGPNVLFSICQLDRAVKVKI